LQQNKLLICQLLQAFYTFSYDQKTSQEGSFKDRSVIFVNNAKYFLKPELFVDVFAKPADVNKSGYSAIALQLVMLFDFKN
jgi:hypothetical protein